MATTKKEHFIHSSTARLISLAVGIGIFIFILFNWKSEIKQVASYLTGASNTPLAHASQQPSEKIENQALAACLDKRLGHIETLKSEGVINDHQHEQFSNRARSLCQAQHPG